MEFYITKKAWKKVIDYAQASYNKFSSEIGGFMIMKQDKEGDYILTNKGENNNTTVYTCPTATQSIIKSILISNDSGNTDTIDITLTDADAGVFSLFKAKSVTSNTTVELLEQPLIIQESEIIKAQATTADRLHIIVSFLEVN